MTPRKLRALVLIGLIILGLIEVGDRLSIPGFQGQATTVNAEVGRPMSPVSSSPVSRAVHRDATDAAEGRLKPASTGPASTGLAGRLRAASTALRSSRRAR